MPHGEKKPVWVDLNPHCPDCREIARWRAVNFRLIERPREVALGWYNTSDGRRAYTSPRHACHRPELPRTKTRTK